MSNGEEQGVGKSVDLWLKQFDWLALGCLNIPLFGVSAFCFYVWILIALSWDDLHVEMDFAMAVVLFYVGSKLLVFSFIGPLMETIAYRISKGWHDGKRDMKNSPWDNENE